MTDSTDQTVQTDRGDLSAARWHHYLWYAASVIAGAVALTLAIQGYFVGWVAVIFAAISVSLSGPLAHHRLWVLLPGLLVLGAALVQLAN